MDNYNNCKVLHCLILVFVQKVEHILFFSNDHKNASENKQ